MARGLKWHVKNHLKWNFTVTQFWPISRTSIWACFGGTFVAFSSNRHISEKLSKIDNILTRPFTKILNFNVSTSVLNMKFARVSKRCEIDFRGFWRGPRFRRGSNHVRTVQSPDRP